MRRQRSMKNKSEFAIVRCGVYIVSVRARRVRVCLYIDPVKAKLAPVNIPRDHH